MELLKRSLTDEPNNPRTHRNLGKLSVEQGNHSDALLFYRQVLALCPDGLEAQFWVEALSGQSSLAKPSAAYMSSLYDERAANYDRDPVELLGYCSPALLQAALGSAPPHRSLSVLDLGCGEGRLLRALLKDPAFVEIVGIDVSCRALEVARERGQ